MKLRLHVSETCWHHCHIIGHLCSMPPWSCATNRGAPGISEWLLTGVSRQRCGMAPDGSVSGECCRHMKRSQTQNLSFAPYNSSNNQETRSEVYELEQFGSSDHHLPPGDHWEDSRIECSVDPSGFDKAGLLLTLPITDCIECMDLTLWLRIAGTLPISSILPFPAYKRINTSAPWMVCNDQLFSATISALFFIQIYWLYLYSCLLGPHA